MRKLYLLIIGSVFLLAANKLSAQCSVGISTNPNTTQLNCTNASITLTANATGTGSKTYLWSTGATASSIIVSAAGIYNVTVKDGAGCTTSSSINITKDVTAPAVTALAFPDTICRGGTATLIGLGAVTYLWQPGSLTGAVVSVSPVSTTTYTVTGTASNGCTSTSTIRLVVHALPAASINGTTTVCQNAGQPSVTFAGSNGTRPYTFTYNVNGGPTQTITTIGTNNSVPVGAPTGTLGTFNYNLISVIDSNGCTQTQSGTTTISVLPGPLLTSAKTASTCDNTLFTYRATSSVAGTNFSWVRSAVPGIRNGAGSGSTPVINETLDNTTLLPVVVNYVFALSNGTGCVTTDSVKVTVNPTPVVNPVGNTSYCNGDFVSGGIPFASSSPDVFFTWTNSNTNIGLPAGGSGNILPFNAKNTTAAPITATITVFIKASADSCAGTSTTFTITVLPAPLLTSPKTGSICDNALFTYTATGSAAGTRFSWTRTAVAGISNSAASGTTATINETLNNSTSQPVVVNYVFTLSTGTGCITTDTLKLTVNPIPVINSITNKSYCNGDFVSAGIPFVSSTPDASFTWTNSNTNIGLPASGSGNILPFNAKDTTVGPITATITVFIKASTDSCPGTGITFTITVLPAPVLTSPKTASICDNKPFTYAATSSATGTSFNWRRAAVAGISNGPGSGSAAVNETLDNTTRQPVVVNYVFTLSTGTGCITTDSVKVTVNPTPVIDPVSNKSYCNGDFVSGGIPFLSTSPDASFTWTNNNTNIGLPASGSGNILPFNAKDTTAGPITATITVFIKASTDGCTGTSTTFTITVLPAPVLTSPKTAGICDNDPFTYTATSSATGTSFSWTRATAAGISNGPGSGLTAAISETLNNTTLQPLVVNYVFTLSTGTGCVTTDSVLVTVNPTPEINPVSDTTFCNREFVSNGIPFTSSSPGAAFTWSNSNTNIGLAASGSGNIPAFNTANNTNGIDSAIITVNVKASSDSCTGAGRTFKIRVRPGPALTSSKTASVCNNTLFPYTATSSATGTNFSWARAFVTGISNTAAGDATATINETLNNTTSQPVDVIYVFSLSTGSDCINTDSIKVTVNPTPKIDSLNIHPYLFCNNSLVQPINLSSHTNDALLSWTSDPSIGFGTVGTGNIPAFIANNQSSIPLNANVKVMISVGNGCQGDSVAFTITVFPTPVLTSIKDTSVCDSLPFNYMAESYAAGTTFNWIRPAITGINNPAGSGITAAINETLDNITPQPVDVYYYFTLFTGITCSTHDTLKVTVNPTPIIQSIPDYTFCNGVPVSGISFNSLSPNASFTWTCDTTIGFGLSGSDSIPAFIATNTGTIPVVDTVAVSITASSDRCSGPSTTFTITVNPSPPKPNFTSLFSYPDNVTLQLCSGSENINFDVNSPVPGVSYSWTSTANSSMVFIRDTNDANTVISFKNPGIDTINAIATNTTGNCTDIVSQVVEVNNLTGGIDKRRIFLMQPGNLLTYPNNSLTGYQWGYDSIIHTSPDSAFGPSAPVQGQVYQFFIPGTKFLDAGSNSLDETNYLYWVLLQNGSCYTRVYYNGPYANRPAPSIPSDSTIQLQVMPNPNNGIFEIALKGNIYGTMDVKIYNSTGQVVSGKNFVKTVPEITEIFNTDNLPGGLYFLVLNSSDLKRVVSRFVIQH